MHGDFDVTCKPDLESGKKSESLTQTSFVLELMSSLSSENVDVASSLFLPFPMSLRTLPTTLLVCDPATLDLSEKSHE